MSDITLSKAVRTNLLSLQNTADLMATTQNRLATGKKVNSALDNPTNFFTASSLNSRASDMNSLLDSMANGIQVLEAADNGISAITKTVESMQSTLRQARQDKSFQTESFDVTSDSVLNISGGTLPEGINVSLPEPGEGSKASLMSSTAFTGPTAAAFDEADSSTDATAGGAGARTILSFDDIDTDLAGETITVDGKEVTFAAGTATDDADEIVTQMQAQLGEGYKVGKDSTTGQIVIENAATTGAASTAPVVDLGDAGATFGSTTFAYDSARMGQDVTVDGETVSVGGSIEEFAANLQTALGGTAGDYTVSANTEDGEITVTSKIAGSTAPAITSAPEQAARVELSINGDTTGDTIAGVNITGNPATAADVADALNADGGFSADYTASVSQDTGKLVITAKDPTAAVSTITGLAFTDAGTASFSGQASFEKQAASIASATGASRTYDVDASVEDTTVFGVDTTGLSVTDAATLADALNADDTFAADYTATVNGDGQLVVTTNDVGSTADFNAVAAIGGQADANGITAASAVVDGQNAVTGTPENGVAGVTQSAQAAVTQSFTVTYGNKQTEVTIGAGEPEDIAASINEQLTAAGIAVEASIGETGELSLAATSAEAKTLALSGGDSAAIFGGNTVDIGENPEAALNATKTVDKFVELINRDYGTSIRASNDNGRLRIENLSTTDMSVGVDKDGDASVDTTSTIEGNSVRDSLAAQFNELKDQLDKLADDASFNGINLLRGDKLTITFNESGSSSIDIQTKDGDPITAGNLSIDSLAGSDLDSDANIDKLLSTLGTALNELRSQASSFGSNLSSVQNRQDFTKNMINTLETGAANLTLADSNEEAANLLALQTRQQLSSTALSMASQQDQAVLRLF